MATPEDLFVVAVGGAILLAAAVAIGVGYLLAWALARWAQDR
jgi:hypothetical protein